MQSKNTVVEEQNFLVTLKTIATAYQEISVMKMKQTRASIEHSRLFVERLKVIFESLKFSYPIIKKREDELKTKQLAKVLITANSKFHGDILRKIFQEFVKNDKQKGDIFVVGRIGKDFLHEYNALIKYTYVDIPDNSITSQSLKPLIQDLLKYTTVEVYYAQFKSVVQQDVKTAEIPSIYSLLEEEEEHEKQMKHDETVPLFLFEPSGEVIAEFLNDNTTITLMKQTLFETQLARYASRIKAMDALLRNIEDDQKELKREKTKIQRNISGKKQQERLSGIFLWQTQT
ncbi:F0F1 ATP synthase subunit gamma [Candidatus Woesebacteria bacterium]|nr:F0F1 ATP synthase subunit gamma [Candidatus Woesebacteria bacterium]